MTKKITLDTISSQITILAKQVTVLTEDVLEIKETMATKSDIANLERGQQEIRDELEPLSRAHDKDAVTVLDHDKRISRVEKRLAVR